MCVSNSVAGHVSLKEVEASLAPCRSRCGRRTVMITQAGCRGDNLVIAMCIVCQRGTACLPLDEAREAWDRDHGIIPK